MRRRRHAPTPQRPLGNQTDKRPPLLSISIVTAIPTVIMMGVSLITLNLAQNEDLRFPLWCTIITGGFQLSLIYNVLCECLALSSRNYYQTRQNLDILTKLVVDFFMGTLCIFLTAGQYAYSSTCIICWLPNLIIIFGMMIRVRNHIHN